MKTNPSGLWTLATLPGPTSATTWNKVGSLINIGRVGLALRHSRYQSQVLLTGVQRAARSYGGVRVSSWVDKHSVSGIDSLH